MEGPRAGRRTIGLVAGHEINLEIEGVQDKKSSLTKENNTILFWHNWVANQLTFSPF